MLLGRTFAIADHDINVELPSSDIAFWDLTSAHSPADHGTFQSNIIPFIHDIRLRQLQSKIQRTVFRVDIDQNLHSPEDRAREDAEVEAIRHQLDIWVNNIPAAAPATQDEARWMDKRLFNFDLLEATRACTTCLTIFGERWPGAVRYGEIFETLQGSVIRAIMEPKPSRNLGRDLDMLVEPATAKIGAPNHTDPLLGAVKDVFMEVDEDVPGGGQGWRLFTEMVQSDIQVPDLMAGEGSKAATTTRHSFPTSIWSDGSAVPLSNLSESFQPEQGGPGVQGAWDHGFFAGYD
ncbi:uncharacterized protein N0V89_005828 [Didymosphaeria variabile]|uniref:Xylanolytic transcriptional activator regulatory domain-containing protein n=1 Tax=Didymosphaeria variabile TaxID=1932322 RepID=A0A9W9CBM6_9PLEO|nr:uncharacterized protein N0V89_005828 [Didymosphaeria variabile]KAJ4354095.1 hypothetical protein N0V89_005828 [Didymosphaeria variabile]